MIDYRNNKRRFGIFVATCLLIWGVAFAVLWQLFPYPASSRNSGLPITKNNALQTGTGKFHLSKEFPPDYYLKKMDIYANDISISNDKIGFFRSYILRKVLIMGLDIEFQTNDGFNHSLSPTADTNTASVADIFGGFSKSPQSGANWQIDFDTSNLLSLIISDFNCRFINEQGQILLSVSAKRASVRDKDMQILLEGNVAIETQQRRILRTNKAIWDISNQTFTANGAYSLTEQGQQKTGKNVKMQYQGCSLDMQMLNNLIGKGNVK
jgi:hypothetical protein